MTKVTLRSKPITGGRQTLYLDYYPAIKHPDTGKSTRREFLGIYVIDEWACSLEKYTDAQGKPQKRLVKVVDAKGQPKKAKLSPMEKQHNQQVYALAESIRAKRLLEIQKGDFGFLSDVKQQANFIDYFTALAKKRAGSNSDNWFSALNFLKEYAGKEWRFKDLNEASCLAFQEFLLRAPSKRSTAQVLSQNSAVSYFNKFKAALNQAFKDGYLSVDLNKRIPAIKAAETERQFLVYEELVKLAQTNYLDMPIKRGALFSALTGLRFSDIQKLTWADVHYSEQEGYLLKFRQQKTKSVEVLPISEDAFELLGEKGSADELAFKGLAYSAWQNKLLQDWVESVGIAKKISFHCFRHTYATLQLTFGTDLYTVSKLLGHRNIKTTQVYAKVIDKVKREAANKLNFGRKHSVEIV